jgi:hypothetical protein
MSTAAFRIALWGGTALLLATAGLASARGWGVPATERRTVDVREDSAPGSAGHAIRRRMVGGGLHSGK